MNVRSLVELDSFLDEELSRRKRELTTLKLLVGARRGHEVVLLLRAAICMLYAHWEGFVRSAGTAYIAYVSRQGLNYQDLTPSFVALGLRTEITRAGQSSKASARRALVAKLLLGLGDRAEIDWRNAVDTRSNSDSDTLNEIIALLGLDSREYLLDRQRLDSKLVATRNSIAHGQLVQVDINEYLELHDFVLGLVERFRVDVGNAAALREYRREERGLAVVEDGSESN